MFIVYVAQLLHMQGGHGSVAGGPPGDTQWQGVLQRIRVAKTILPAKERRRKK